MHDRKKENCNFVEIPDEPEPVTAVNVPIAALMKPGTSARLVHIATEVVPYVKLADLGPFGFLIVYETEVVLYGSFAQAIDDAELRRRDELEELRLQQLEDDAAPVVVRDHTEE